MNYDSGNGLIVPTGEDPLEFSTSFTPITFPAPVSHPTWYSSRGADRIWRLVEDGAPGTWRIQGQINQPLGSGPRHIATRGNMLYTLHELASTLTQQLIPPAPNGTTPLIANFSILPPGLPEGAAMAAAEILVAEASLDFPAPYIYVSNRSTWRRDRHFQVEPELKLLKYVYTGLDQIRGMQLGGPQKEFLIASGVAGDAGVIMLRRTEGGADLELLTGNLDVPTRTSFVWLD
ncbi:hypothetical protein A0H81_01940 [Grifola frondosa]|uniref:Uncharacterized protein n=1 Tax=Grifola frondosa TaxID=5627 RepID=A0A1C7MMS0_GRIFR|nr:hypothetical protein A0H81_01940 [Grifola frondosa]